MIVRICLFCLFFSHFRPKLRIFFWENGIVYCPKIGKLVKGKLESFKYVFRVKFRANYNWYPTKNMKFDYAFFV